MRKRKVCNIDQNRTIANIGLYEHSKLCFDFRMSAALSAYVM